MNMLLWSTDVTGDEYLPIFEMLKDAGYEGVEVPIFELDPEPYVALGDRLREIGLEPIGVTARGEDANPISADPEVRRAGLRENVQTLDCTQALGASVVLGPLQTGLGVFTGSGPTRGCGGCSPDRNYPPRAHIEVLMQPVFGEDFGSPS